MIKQLPSAGFTIVELMIATGVFSIVLLLCSTAILVIGKQYHKAAIASVAQDTSRNIIDDVARQIQISGAVPVGNSDVNNAHGNFHVGEVKAICIGSVRYTYAIGWQVDDSSGVNPATHKSPHALWRDTITAGGPCITANLNTTNPSAGTGGSNGTEMLALHTRLREFSVADPTAVELWSIDVGILYGDDDLLVPQPTAGHTPADVTPTTNCITLTQGGVFCGASDLHTAIFRRHS